MYFENRDFAVISTIEKKLAFIYLFENFLFFPNKKCKTIGKYIVKRIKLKKIVLLISIFCDLFLKNKSIRALDFNPLFLVTNPKTNFKNYFFLREFD
jgi:hypothetical protein